jgi:hypothetical protein
MMGLRLDSPGAQSIHTRIDQFAARLAMTPRSLKAEDRRALMREVKVSGCMEGRLSEEELQGLAPDKHLGVSRAAVYTYAK